MGERKRLQILLSYSQAGPARKAKQGQEEISRNHVPTFFLGSVHVKDRFLRYFNEVSPKPLAQSKIGWKPYLSFSDLI